MAVSCAGVVFSALPTRAIVFGSLNDPNSKVSQLHADTRRYDDARKMLDTERLDVVQVCARCDRIPAWSLVCLERGLLINCTHSTVIRLLPAVNIPDDLIDEGCELLADVLLNHNP